MHILCVILIVYLLRCSRVCLIFDNLPELSGELYIYIYIYIFVGERERACMCVWMSERSRRHMFAEKSPCQVMKTLPAHQRESVLTTLNLIRHSHIHLWWFCSLSVCECLWRKPHCKILILWRFVPVLKGPLHSSWKSHNEEHLKNVFCLAALFVL